LKLSQPDLWIEQQSTGQSCGLVDNGGAPVDYIFSDCRDMSTSEPWRIRIGAGLTSLDGSVSARIVDGSVSASVETKALPYDREITVDSLPEGTVPQCRVLQF